MPGLLAHFVPLWPFLVDPRKLEIVQMRMEIGEVRIYQFKKIGRTKQGSSICFMFSRDYLRQLSTVKLALSVPAGLDTFTV